MQGDLDKVEYSTHEIFGLQMPVSCPNVPESILNPRNTWSDKDNYDKVAAKLAEKFVKNFEKFEEFANEEIMNAAPRTSIKA
jgi:phosphoenolpyruvate carboxykinase (ATP)